MHKPFVELNNGKYRYPENENIILQNLPEYINSQKKLKKLKPNYFFFHLFEFKINDVESKNYLTKMLKKVLDLRFFA